METAFSSLSSSQQTCPLSSTQPRIREYDSIIRFFAAELDFEVEAFGATLLLLASFKDVMEELLEQPH
uniref:Uncharacterized protein n=1 Tax=Cucumis sativus TaxID=3659 RepID=A0A0A0KHI1_CUCSA